MESHPGFSAADNKTNDYIPEFLKTGLAKISTHSTTWQFKTVGEFSLICCTSLAHAENAKIWAKIISAYAKKCSITGFSSLRGGGGAKNASIYALSGHERIEKRSDQ